jgi:hypothetical protein
MTHWRILLACVSVVAVANCVGSNDNSVGVDFSIPVAQACDKNAAADRYFRPGLFRGDNGDNRFRDKYAQILIQAGESPLWCGDAAEEAYRLIFVDAWDATALVARASRTHETMTVISVSLANQEPGNGSMNVVERSINSPTDVQWFRLKNSITDSQFMSIPRLPLTRLKEPATFDATMGLFEVRTRERYHVVYRQASKLRELTEPAKLLFEIARRPLPREVAADVW